MVYCYVCTGCSAEAGAAASDTGPAGVQIVKGFVACKGGDGIATLSHVGLDLDDEAFALGTLSAIRDLERSAASGELADDADTSNSVSPMSSGSIATGPSGGTYTCGAKPAVAADADAEAPPGGGGGGRRSS